MVIYKFRPIFFLQHRTHFKFSRYSSSRWYFLIDDNLLLSKNQTWARLLIDLNSLIAIKLVKKLFGFLINLLNEQINGRLLMVVVKKDNVKAFKLSISVVYLSRFKVNIKKCNRNKFVSYKFNKFICRIINKFLTFRYAKLKMYFSRLLLVV